MNPLIATLRLDHESSQFFDRERERFFPPKRNFLAAHVTLFHHLPAEAAASVGSDLTGVATGQARFRVSVEGLRFLGYSQTI